MKNIEVVLPAMGEGITDATVTKWLISIGQSVEEDTPLVEIATDKVDSEIPAPAAGKLASILFQVGEIPKVGQVIAIIEAEGESDEPIALKPTVEVKSGTIISAPSAAKVEHTSEPIISDSYLSPLVKSIVKEENISKSELSSIQGTGVDGRITKEDVISFLKRRSDTPAPIAASKPNTAQPKPQETNQEVEVVVMDRMRKLIADHM